MTSAFERELNPRANVFIFVNLGCEMLYVIDQRLKGQQIEEQKSIQVIHDIIAMLLDPKFIDSLIVGSTHHNSQLVTIEHCKFMLNDIATSSLMRIDDNSMDKLWNLMTMFYKWQLFVSKQPHHLLDITFRHLDSIAKIHADNKRKLLIDFTKSTLLDFWNSMDDNLQLSVYNTNKAWIEYFHTKISLLIRLGFQSLDGNLLIIDAVNYCNEYVESIGENIYEKTNAIANKKLQGNQKKDQFMQFLNSQLTNNDELQPIDAFNVQKQLENSLQQCNILFSDLNVNKSTSFNDPITLDSDFFDESILKQNENCDNFIEITPVCKQNAQITDNAINSTDNDNAVVGNKIDILNEYFEYFQTTDNVTNSNDNAVVDNKIDNLDEFFEI